MRRAGILLLLLGLARPAEADDHQDAPATLAQPAADLTGLYAWTSGRSQDTKLNLILGIQAPLFSPDFQYVFHIASGPAYDDARSELEILCQFESDQRIACWVGEGLYLAGNAKGSAGLASPDGRLRIFAGLRNDPCFFNLQGLQSMIRTLGPSLAGLAKDAPGCPRVPANTANQLVTQLMQDGQQGPAQNDYAGGPGTTYPGQISALVIQIDKALVAQGGDVLAIWASTHAR